MEAENDFPKRKEKEHTTHVLVEEEEEEDDTILRYAYGVRTGPQVNIDALYRKLRGIYLQKIQKVKNKHHAGDENGDTEERISWRIHITSVTSHT